MLPRTASHDSQHATGSTCATSALPRALISRSPSTRSRYLPARAPARTCTRTPRARRPPREREESVLPPRRAGFGRAQPVPRRAGFGRAQSVPRRARRNAGAGAALLVFAPPPPCALTPRRIPERATRPCRAPHRAGFVPEPRLGISPRALLLVLAPRTPCVHRPPREREESVQRPVALASFALSLRSSSYLHPIRAPRSPNPREYVSPRAHRSPALRHLPPPRAAHASFTASPRLSTGTRCLPTRAQGVTAAPSSHLHRPNAARARGRGALASYPTRRPRASFARSLGVLG
ncbi:hypothetical protein DFH09DRAFT_1441151 [Mycena vulgaris]|nr:hypothetical protein DFH09DRAFT_1441151 [Mycena vulgaris]